MRPSGRMANALRLRYGAKESWPETGLRAEAAVLTMVRWPPRCGRCTMCKIGDIGHAYPVSQIVYGHRHGTDSQPVGRPIMAKQRKGKRGICSFCGRRRLVTSDHIPPKLLFPKATNCITVPACEECNKGSSKDDELLRLLLAMSAGASSSPQVEHLIEPTLRVFERGESQRFAHGVLSAVADVEVTTPSGIYLGKVPALKLEPSVLPRIARKIVTGLFCHQFGYRLPIVYGVAANAFHSARIGMAADECARSYRSIAPLLIDGEPRVVGNGTLAYRFGRAKHSRYRSAWAIVICGVFEIHALTDRLDGCLFQRWNPSRRS